MSELLVPPSVWDQVASSVLGDVTERCCILFAYEVITPQGKTRLLGRECVVPVHSDYLKRGPFEAQLAPGFVARITKTAKLCGYSIIFVHSHPGEMAPTFSSIDHLGEQVLAAFLAHRLPRRKHAAMVMSSGGVRCRSLAEADEIKVVVIGPIRNVLTKLPTPESYSPDDTFERQIRAFGEHGQRILGELTIGIIGLGGTGSLIAEQLTHLGVRRFILIDPDVIELTNLNRVVNARSVDIGSPKVEVTGRFISAFQPAAQINAIKGDVIWARDGKALLDADLLFGCTDSHGSRAVLEQVAYQFLIPLIDMGSIIDVSGGEIKHVVGRVQMVAPGLACFSCSGLLDPMEVRRDMMSAFEKKNDPYIQGQHEPAPAVISLNGTVASLAVTMMMAVIVGLPAPARHLIYLALNSSLRSVVSVPESGCLTCSDHGRVARGNSWPFPGRQD